MVHWYGSLLETCHLWGLKPSENNHFHFLWETAGSADSRVYWWSTQGSLCPYPEDKPVPTTRQEGSPCSKFPVFRNYVWVGHSAFYSLPMWLASQPSSPAQMSPPRMGCLLMAPFPSELLCCIMLLMVFKALGITYIILLPELFFQLISCLFEQDLVCLSPSCCLTRCLTHGCSLSAE